MTKLVTNGKLQLGSFPEPLDDANLIDSVPKCLRWAPRQLRSLRLKEWQAVQIGTPRFFMIIALFDAKFMSIAQAKIYDRELDKKYVFEQTLPPWSFKNPQSLLDSASRFKRHGCEIRFENQLEQGSIGVHLHLRETSDRPHVDAVFKMHAETAEPMIRSIPFASGRSMYSHKGLMPVSGAIRVGDTTEELEGDDAFGFIDHHKGYYGREMTWDWVTGAGFQDGSLVGFNLTANDSIRREEFTENGFWIGDKLHLLPAVHFTRTQNDGKTWRVFDRNGLVDVTFDIEVPGHLDLNFGVIQNRYLGPFGRFEGTLRSADGTELELKSIFGMGEKFYLKA